MTGVLHLVRHGQTTANVAKILDTLPPGAPLTPLGVEQARGFAAARPGTSPAALLSSVARRAQQTAENIGAGWGVPYRAVDGAQEVQAGDLEGLSDDASIEQFQSVIRRWYAGETDVRIPGGESARDVLDRFLPVVENIRRDHLGRGDAYLVSHGAAIRVVAAHLTGVDAEFAHENHLPNTGEIVLRPIDGGWELVSWAEETAAADADPMG